jgi:hypothetical protein
MERKINPNPADRSVVAGAMGIYSGEMLASERNPNIHPASASVPTAKVATPDMANN